jgi:hypothetical protein
MCFTALRPLSGCCSQLGLSFLQFLSTLLNRRNYLPFRSCCARINSRIFEFVARANFRDREKRVRNRGSHAALIGDYWRPRRSFLLPNGSEKPSLPLPPFPADAGLHENG